MPFSTTQQAAGQSAVTDLIAYDSLGMSVQVRLTAVMENCDNTTTTYRWFADSPDNQNGVDSKIACGTGLIMFDGEGNFTTATEETVSIYRRDVPSASPLEFELDFSQISGLAADKATLAVSRQDGSGPGTLTSFIIGEDGMIRGVFSNGITRDLGQIRLARFGNPAGLEQRGENLYSTGVNSGLPVEGNPGEQGIGSIIAGATELSNTDIGREPDRPDPRLDHVPRQHPRDHHLAANARRVVGAAPLMVFRASEVVVIQLTGIGAARRPDKRNLPRRGMWRASRFSSSREKPTHPGYCATC